MYTPTLFENTVTDNSTFKDSSYAVGDLRITRPVEVQCVAHVFTLKSKTLYSYSICDRYHNLRHLC